MPRTETEGTSAIGDILDAERSGGGGLVGMLLPRRPREEKRAGDTGNVGPGARVWVLHDGEPQAIQVKTGATNGLLTQVVAGPLEPGTEVLIDALAGPR